VGFVVEIFAYDIRYSKDPRFTPHCTKEISTSETSSEIFVTNLESNTIYYFMHRARNEVGH